MKTLKLFFMAGLLCSSLQLFAQTTVNETQYFPQGGRWDEDGSVYIGRHQSSMHPIKENVMATHLNWSGHSLMLGTPTGVNAHNYLEIYPGGSTTEPLISVLELYTAWTPEVEDHVSKIRFVTEGSSYINGGFVGIGTTNPGCKLDVVGTIRAHEIFVNLDNGGADFVFEPDYKLMPLREVHSFVTSNRHLPEVPSAAEMEEKGINVNELQIKLLQKIEELTLYLIDQNNTIEQLKMEIEELKK